MTVPRSERNAGIDIQTCVGTGETTPKARTGDKMAQPNVAREPSMEDILASIRRIIESNEPDAVEPAEKAGEEQAGFDAANDSTAGDAEQEEIRLTVDDHLPDVASVAVPPPSRVEAAPAPVSSPLVDQERHRETERRPMSMADVAARVRAASDRVPGKAPRAGDEQLSGAAGQARSVELRPHAAPVGPEDVSQQIMAAAARPAHPMEAGPLHSSMSRDDVHTASQAAIAGAPRSAEAELASIAANDRLFQPERATARKAELSRSGEVGQSVEPAASDNGARALLSPQAGLQVARSFDELAEMVQTTAKRSLDDVAEDLLRPLLQEWLDDNLPTLVERLVREEIERVARGPRR